MLDVNRQTGPLRARITQLNQKLAGVSDGGDERFEIANLLTEADTLLRSFDYAGTGTVLDTAAQKLAKLWPEQRPVPTADAVQKSLERVQKSAQELWGTAKERNVPPNPQITSDMEGVISRLYNIGLMLDGGKDALAADALRGIEECRLQVEQRKKTLQEYQLFVTKRGELDTTFNTAHDKIAQQVTRVYSESGVVGGESGKLNKTLADIKSRWEQGLDKALSLGELAADSFMAELKLVADEVEALDGDQSQKAGLKGSVEFDGIASRYELAQKELKTEADRVLGVDSDKASKLGLLSVVPALGKEGDTALAQHDGDALEAVIKKMQTKIAEIKKQAPDSGPSVADEMRRQCEAFIQDYTRRINLGAGEIKKEGDRLNVIDRMAKEELTALTEYGEQLKSDLEVIASALVSKDFAMLSDTHSELAGFGARVTQYEKMLPGGKHDKAAGSFGDILKRIKEVETRIGHSALVPHAEQTKPWTDELKEMKDGISKADPNTVKTRVEKIAVDVEKAIEDAKSQATLAKTQEETVLDWIDEIKSPKKNLEQMIAGSADYFDALARRMSKLVKSLQEKKVPDDAEFNALNAEKTKALTPGKPNDNDDPNDKLRKAGQEQALKDNSELAAAKLTLDTLIEVDLKLLAEKAKAMTNETERKALEKQVKQMTTAAESGRSSLEKTRDVKAAETLAKSLKTRIATAEGAPLGQRVTTRNNLPAVDGRWKKAVAGLHGNLDKLGEAVTQACTGDQAAIAVAGNLKTGAIEPVKKLFRTDAFTASIKCIAGTNEAASLDAREDALREIRRIRRMLTADVRVRTLAGNTFNVPLALDEIDMALWDFETNLLMSG